MNPIEPVIKPGDSGPHVANLQAGILLLVEHGVIKTYDPPNMPTPDDLKTLAQKLRSEQAAQLFGAATQQLLRYIQIQQGLGDHLLGIVEDGTAKMLNELLKALGAFESSDLSEVFGTLREAADMSPASGVRVMAYDQDVARLAPLGEAHTDGDGQYRITFGPAAFRATAAERGGPELLVHALNDQGAVIGKSKLVRNAGRRTELSFLVESRCAVRGTVTDQRGTPVAGHKVVAYDQDLRTRQRLGDAQTDARGHYEIPYQHEAALQAEGGTSPAPDLVIEVLPHDSLVPLGTSPVRFHAKRVETIDLLVNVPDEGPTEFEQITAAIMPLLKGQGATGIGTGTHEAPADLSPEDITANDLDFIVLETGLDRTAVHAWAVSSRMVGDAVLRLTDEHAAQQRLLREHGWPFFYALVRQGGEGNLDAVLRNTTSDWQRAWRAARAVNQVSAPDEQRVEELMAVLSLLQRVQQLDPSRAGNSEFVRVLAGAPLPLPVTVALDALAVVQEKGLDDTGSLLKLSERYPEAEAPIKTFVRTVRVHRLAGGQVEFSRVLNGRLEGASDSIEPLARMRAVDWIGMAEEAGVSPGLALQTQAQVEQLHPLTALESKLHAGLFQLPGVLLNEAADLIKNQPAMVENLLLGKVPVKVEETTTQTMLRNTGRFLRTGVSMELAEDLMKKGISSPGVALRYGPEHLRKQYRDTLPEAAVTEVVDRFVRHADGLVEGGKGITIEIDINRRGPSYYRQKDLEEYKVPLPEAVRENAPTLAALFGDLDECICRPCESMLGQPAYLVDLLNLLAKSTGTNGSALDELRSRRPDIFNLKLSCENAEQTIQHIDIVLEILEKAAAREAAPGATADAIRQIAYPKLRQAIYPWHLPFDLGYAAVSAYLAKLGVSRAKLLELQRGAVPAHVASEALHAPMDQAGNSDADSQWELLTQQRLGTRLWAVYGFNIANDIGIIDPASRELLTNQKVQDVLIRVSVLIDRTGLSLEDLEQTLKTAFVSGNSSGIALSGREQCKTSAMRLSAEGPVLEGILDRLHRFTRVKAKLPEWSIEHLGQAIVVCGGIESGATTDQQRADLLVKLTTIKRLHEAYGLPLAALLERPMSESRLRKTLGLSLLQYNLLKELTGYRPAAQPMDWSALDGFCRAARRLREIGLTVEQAAHALLTRGQWEAVAGELPDSIKSSKQIEELLGSVQQRLRAVVAVRPDVGLEAQVAEALNDIFDRMTAGKVMQGIREASGPSGKAPGDAVLAELVATLSGAASHSLGEWLPIMDAQQSAALFSGSNHSADERFISLLTAVASRRREKELIAALAEQCGLVEADVSSLLDTRLLLDPVQGQPLYASEAFLARSFWDDVSLAQPVPPSVTAVAMPRLHAWMDRLYRLIPLSTALAIDSELMEISEQVVVGASAGINWRDMLASTPVNSTAWQNPQWQALIDLLWLQQPEQLSRPALGELVSRLAASGALVSADTLRPLTARVDISDTPDTLAKELMAQAISVQSNSITARDLRNPGKLRVAFEWLLLAKQLGANAAQIALLLNPANNALAADTARSLLESKMVGEDLKTSLQVIGDSLRRQRRDALVAYHVAQVVGRNNSDKWRDAKSLYEHVLIDHQMEPCFETTRIVEAVTAVQLFAQRILFGVESRITADTELKQRWTWMRNYRVWEANRKVFLFPENWLFPELRDDKSSSFKQLESALGQGELNQDLANQSFGRFLDDVAQMGQVQVLGMYEDISRDANGNILKDDTQHPLRRTLYVVGRTPNPPYAYFWRHCVDFGSPYMEWSPWQRIELDIQGDHVLPFVLGGSLHIAWPLIRNVRNESNEEWEIKLAWSRHDGKGWRKSSISRDAWRNEVQPFGEERGGFALRCETTPDGGSASIIVYALAKISGAAKSKPPAPFPYDATLQDASSILADHRPGSATDALPISRLSELMSNGFSSLPQSVKDHLEVYSMRRRHRGNPTYDLLADTIFANPGRAYNLHRDALRNDRSLVVPGATAIKADIRTFIEDFLKDSYSGSRERFSETVDAIFAMTSIRSVACKAWIRVKDPTVGEDLLMLDGRKGSYSCVLGGIPISPGGPSGRSIKLGEHEEIPSGQLTLFLSGGKSPVSTPERVAGVPAGKLANQTVHFEIDGTTLTKTQLSELGIDFTAIRILSGVAEFRLTRDDNVTVLSGKAFLGNGRPLSNWVDNSQPWMNGYQETESAPALPLSIKTPVADTAVFDPWEPPPSSAPAPFWIVGAAASQLHSRLPLIWHCSGNNVGRYVDLGYTSGLANNGFPVYPDSYKEGTQRRSYWSEFLSLEEPSLQYSTFGADVLPLPRIGVSESWDKATQGSFTFDARMPYACYNWEVFFHAPLLIADQLSKQHKFEDAERWLRYVFDPTTSEVGADATRFLKFKAFKDLKLNQQVIDDLTALAQVAGGFASDVDVGAVRKLIDRWRDAPFRPFLIARRRHIAFLWRTLFAYLDNLIAWGDSLYRRDTRESINEATMLYVLAERILGRRPQLHQGKSNRPAHTYDQNISNWDEFANFWIDVGAQGHSNLKTAWRVKDDINQPNPDGMLYFCMPFNDKILSYWNTVDARLSNIRNCRNIEGVQRKLPLMDAPIDPELLVRATAAGLDLGDVIAGLYAPPPHYRYSILSARAAELANECKSLGAAMLSAIEKRDAEYLAQLRSSNEINLLKLVRDVRTLQITEAERNIEALRTSRKSLESRYTQHQRLLGKKDIALPKEQESTGEESMLGRVDDGTSGLSHLGLIDAENKHIEDMDFAYGWTVAGGITKGVAGATHMSASIVRAAMASTADAGKVPAEILTAVGTGLSTVGDMFDLVSRGWQHSANRQSILGGHLRRRDEWAFQSNQILKELQQIDKQILANQIRIDITKTELSNHLEQIEQAKAVDEVMRSKFSNVQLYEWMKTELSKLYFNAYRMALDMARKAERAAARELGVKPLNILGNGHWDSLRDGLLAGERLHQDLKRLEVTYLDQNRREYEMTKHISLRRLKPEALMELRIKNSTTGRCRCEFDIPEWLLDLDTPGHYLRRIKSVSVTIPSVTGPYTSVSCKLTLLKSMVRHERSLKERNRYLRLDPADDDRFTDYFGASEAIVTSTSNGDSGLFETQLRDERFLPFEGSGMISTWRLELPDTYPQFDYSTISDVVLSIRYTARDGGDSLREAATDSIATLMQVPQPPETTPLRFPVVLSCRSDFPTEWARAGTTSDLKIPFTRNLLPYWMDAAKLVVREVRVADLPTVVAGPLDFKPVWPPPTGVTNPASWPAAALNGDGVGEGNLGRVTGVIDKMILLNIGVRGNPSPSPP
jgi:Tc toxin complex TcA C-terminal TcB-binding domain/Neuraminidase-like domain/Salmonella virulence plasmid 28.1kDa A protein